MAGPINRVLDDNLSESDDDDRSQRELLFQIQKVARKDANSISTLQKGNTFAERKWEICLWWLHLSIVNESKALLNALSEIKYSFIHKDYVVSF